MNVEGMGSMKRGDQEHVEYVIGTTCFHRTHKHDWICCQLEVLAGLVEDASPIPGYLLTSPGGRFSEDFEKSVQSLVELGKGIAQVWMGEHGSSPDGDGCKAEAAGERIGINEAAWRTRSILDKYGFTETPIYRFFVDRDSRVYAIERVAVIGGDDPDLDDDVQSTPIPFPRLPLSWRANNWMSSYGKPIAAGVTIAAAATAVRLASTR